MEIKIHEFQISILRELLFKPNARFRDLKKVDITNDHFTFHLKHLLKEGLVVKTNGRYSLTDDGKEFANRMDTDALKLERQAKLAVALHAVREHKGITEYLVHQRLKEPFYGWYGSHSGKIRWGENPQDCAKREFLEETGLTGKFELKGIIHYHHFHKDGRLLEDKYFWVYRVDNVKGKLKKLVPEGRNIWMSEKEYRKLKNVFATVDEVIEIVNSKTLLYIDRPRVVEEY
ncbi:MAG: NUDIX hydrolase [Candidatus Woesebacteria bacterium GW2011_GWB1_39_12]|uniref:NUDIX hydrolase n=2 Tax=Candidatus Woeseibacteriota TaxID=1752722 RepID=A0A0G0M5S1_9BACT|nr:MAG: NUDIX hydrolase [Candidatus Woesebacteria bacterium GW2011_GWA1_39_12]KKR00750.1 MAG: NUDIX hydrolase [Candidatus Woesebacteria bacterium GW2011_GWB1_39_12]